MNLVVFDSYHSDVKPETAAAMERLYRDGVYAATVAALLAYWNTVIPE